MERVEHKLRTFLIFLLLLLSGNVLLALPDGVYWTPIPGEGYLVTHLATSRLTPSGTEITTNATFSYTVNYSDGTSVRLRRSSNPVTITVGELVETKEWTYTASPHIDCLVDIANCGEGGVEINGPIFTVYVLVPNDGKQHRFSWLSVLKG